MVPSVETTLTSNVGQMPSPVESTSKEPNFFIVGAPRAGTTSLWQYLRQHPDVFMPPNELTKEPGHFCEFIPPWAPYFVHLEEYLKIFAPANGQRAIGEASTGYLWSRQAAGRIRGRYPRARIIVMLRNPAGRAFSHYRLLCELGFERSKTFERALSVEDERFARYEQGGPLSLDPFWYCASFYYRLGLYADQIPRYLALFPRDRIHFVLFEDLNRRPVETTREVFQFLGVDPSFEPDIKVHNKSYFPLSVGAQCVIGQRWNLHPVGPRTRRPRLRDYTALPAAFMANLWLGNVFRKVTLDPSTRRDLLRRYESDIQRTSKIIGRNLDHWMKDRA